MSHEVDDMFLTQQKSHNPPINYIVPALKCSLLPVILKCKAVEAALNNPFDISMVILARFGPPSTVCLLEGIGRQGFSAYR